MGYKLDDYNPENAFAKRSLPPEGFYHVQLEDVEKIAKKEGNTIKMSWKIVGCPNIAEMQLALGGTVYEYLSSWTPLFPKQFIRVGLACEVYTIEGLKSLKDKGEELPDPDFNSWIGKSCVAKIAHKKRFNDATKIDPSIGWEYYMLNSPEAKEANVILNMDVLDASLAVTPQVELMF